MPLKKQICLIYNDDVDEKDVKAVIDGIGEALQQTNTAGQLCDFGVWSSENYSSNKGLKPHQSVYWYIDQAIAESDRKEQLNGWTLIDLLESKPVRKFSDSRRYEVLITGDDIYNGKIKNDFVNCIGRDGVGLVVSTHRLDGYKCIKKEVSKQFRQVIECENYGTTRMIIRKQVKKNH